jgi:predicted glycoside hydrolase/deacetylase ChbG (UPF0249 family)
MNPGRCLIVNADDFGLSSGVNQGVIGAHEHGIVTSASLMVRWPAATAAAEYARARPELSVGLHLDLGEWTVIDEAWRPAYQVVPTDDAEAVAQEIARQLDLFRRLMGRDPTHLDSHQHVHRSEPGHSLLMAETRKLGVVLRGFDPTVRYCGDFYGQADKGSPYPEGITVEALIRIIEGLPPGITELGCHPGEGADVDSMYCRERATECRTLRDPRVRSAIRENGVVLCSFSNRPA